MSSAAPGGIDVSAAGATSIRSAGVRGNDGALDVSFELNWNTGAFGLSAIPHDEINLAPDELAPVENELVHAIMCKMPENRGSAARLLVVPTVAS